MWEQQDGRIGGTWISGSGQMAGRYATPEAGAGARVAAGANGMSAECLPPSVTSKLIEEAAERAMKNLKNQKAPKPFKVPAPIKMTVEFEQSDMADNAAFLPHAMRTTDRRVDYIADDMVTIYLAFRAMLALAR